MNRSNLFGIWFSEELDSIPNYNSNFTNWVDCIPRKGKIKLTVFILEFLRYVGSLEVPVNHVGGGPGYFPLRSGDIGILEDKIIILVVNSRFIIPYEWIDEKTIRTFIFDREIVFIRE
ncbi:MAG: hypothetical protein AAF487_15265 [Bacteroidota bacterium]